MFEKAKLTWSGKVIPLEIGATPENGGTRSHVLSIGGAETLPFLHSEGHTGFPPALALEVWDMKPPEWSDVLSESFGGVLDQPVEWAQFALQRGAEAICLRMASSHPDFKDTAVAESVRLVKSFIENVSAPLIILGSGHIDKDRELLPALCEVAAGERCLVGPAVEENYRTIAAACMAFGHSLIAESPIDVNLAKQLNILCVDAGLPNERIVMHHLSSALGYGTGIHVFNHGARPARLLERRPDALTADGIHSGRRSLENKGSQPAGSRYADLGRPQRTRRLLGSHHRYRHVAGRRRLAYPHPPGCTGDCKTGEGFVLVPHTLFKKIN